jgi:hypothetical protein
VETLVTIMKYDVHPLRERGQARPVTVPMLAKAAAASVLQWLTLPRNYDLHEYQLLLGGAQVRFRLDRFSITGDFGTQGIRGAAGLSCRSTVYNRQRHNLTWGGCAEHGGVPAVHAGRAGGERCRRCQGTETLETLLKPC